MEVDQAVQNAGGHSYARGEAPGDFFFVYVKPTSLFVCQAGAGNLNNNRPKGNKYHSAKAIMNNIFDIIKSDPGNAYKYMEYMTMLDAAPEP